MKGTIFHQHETRNLCSVQLENGDYTVIELLLNSKVHFGDCVSGKLNDEGFTTLSNDTSLTSFEANVLYVQCTKVEALQKTILV